MPETEYSISYSVSHPVLSEMLHRGDRSPARCPNRLQNTPTFQSAGIGSGHRAHVDHAGTGRHTAFSRLHHLISHTACRILFLRRKLKDRHSILNGSH